MTSAGAAATPRRPVAWVAMEPGEDHVADFELTVVDWPGGERRRLAGVGNHGPPVVWSPRPPAPP